MTTADTSTFPAEVYRDTVLAPLFEGVKAHFTGQHRRINRAHLVMLAETGILPQGTAARIAAALARIDRETDIAALAYTGEVEDYFFLVEALLAEKLGADTAGRLHTARSRNDIDHTVFKLKLKQKIDVTLDACLALAEAMATTARREKSTIIVAYTHGQPAQPSTFGHYLGAALEVLLRDTGRLFEARAIVDLCPMGAAAITTSGFAVDRHRMAELLGFAAPLRNSYGCIAAIDYVTSTYGALKLVFLHLGRLVQDFQAWTGFEVGQLYVPNSFVQVSSIMPQKRNPVPIEHLRLLASLTVGGADMVVNTMHNTPFTDMNDSEGEVQASGLAAFDSGDRALKLAAGLIGAVSIDGARVTANIDASCITVTELADTLVREDGLSFRQAHEIAGDTAKAVVAGGGSLSADGYEPFAAAFSARTGRRTSLDAGAFANVVSPEHFVAVRDRFGGPAPAALDEALAVYDAEIAARRARAERFRRDEEMAEIHLDGLFECLAEMAPANIGE
ncbi:Argininosuccinate lyase [hydrothermal vent metagenome]|uniref:Argininosuccinate lyase n=1 Tax=hydrothermal vent metagenome TaxID=652676 RepID=A0A3B0TUN9_9ZZZZ